MRRSAVLLLFLVLSGHYLGAAAAAPRAVVAGAPAPGLEPMLPCLEEVLPCTMYLKTDRRPPQTCCTALNRAAAAEMPCLCRLLADPGMLVTFNVTSEQMFRLPARCGLPVGCRAGGPGSADPVVEAPPPPAVLPPRRGGILSSGDRCSRSSIGRVIVSVFWGGLVTVAALV